MNISKSMIYAVVSLFILSSCNKEVVWVPEGYGASEVQKPDGEYIADDNFKRIAYCYHTNSISSFDTVKLDYITHLHFAFLTPKEDGSLQTLTSHTNFEALNKLAKEHGVKTAFSIQGNETMFRTIAANQQTRSLLVKNLVDFAVRYDLDGIDLDWEYPRANYGSDVTFELFASELSAELHSWHKYLSVAVTAGLYAGPIKEGITNGALEAMDFVNLMAYDGIGIDPDSPDHHATLVMANRVLETWLTDKNLPREKAVLGLPLYGKSANNNSMTFSSLLDNGAVPTEDQFLFNNTAYYYNGINTIKDKVELAKQSGNGVMFWEYSQDARGANSLMKVAYESSK